MTQPSTQSTPQTQQPVTVQGKPTTTASGMQSPATTNQQTATATTPAIGQTTSQPAVKTTPTNAPTTPTNAPTTSPQAAAKGVSLAGKYSGSLSAQELTQFAEVTLTVTLAATGGGQVNGRVICEKLEVGRLQGTVDLQGQVKLTVRGGQDYTEITGNFTGTLNASGGQGKWQAADGKEKGEGTWTVMAK